MTKTTLLVGMLFVGTTLGFSACGPAVPASPTWKDDVRPLVVARCIRCHDNPPRVDPAIADPKVAPSEAYNFNHPPDVVLDPPPPGLMALKILGPMSVRGGLMKRRMPPPPAAALEDWQIETLANWAAPATLR